MKKIASIFLLLIGLFVLTSIDARAVENQEINNSLIPGATAGILIEQSTGNILYEKEKDRRLSPASMTKIMTLLLIYESMENNSFNKDTMLTTSEYAASMGGSQVYLKVGEKISVDEAIKCICVASANDCAVLMAEEIAGSEEHFVRMMNEKAKSLGCNNTKFSDCTGLLSSDHFTSAHDLAIISRELLNKYPSVLEYTTIKEDYIRKNTSSPFWLVNTNKMIGRVEGLNGLKTGYTSFSGYCIALSMEKDGMGLISVVFGYENSSLRNTESIELLKYGFSNYKLECILKKGTVLESVNHILYKNNIDILVKDDIYHLCKKSDNNKYTYKYSYDLSLHSGGLEVYLNNNEVISSHDVSFSEIPQKKSIWELVGTIFINCFV